MWKSNSDQGKVFGALLTDLSKTFDCLSHYLFLAKLQSYRFDEKSLALANQKQRSKIGQEISI